MSKVRVRVIGILKAFLVSLLGSSILTLISYVLGSCYISTFLSNNLTVVQITILAINIPTVGIILANFSKVAKHNKGIWGAIRSSVLFSVSEQIAYIILGISFMMITDSSVGRTFSTSIIFILNVIQLSMLGMSIATMIDVFQTVVSITEVMNTLEDTETESDNKYC